MKTIVSATVALASFATLVVGAGTPTLPYNVDAPGNTPTYTPRAVPVLLTAEQVAWLAGATTYYNDSPLASAVKRLTGNSKRDEPPTPVEKRGLVGGLFGVTTTGSVAAAAATSKAAVTCIDGTNTVQQINTLFSAGGAGLTIFLCASATINIDQPIIMTASNQTLVTKGYPMGDTRATLRIASGGVTNVITASCANCNNVAIRNLQINGNRPQYGFVPGNYGGDALIEAGGATNGGIIDHVHAYEPRSWSTIHAMEGDKLSCRGMQITNNQLGPAGQAPSGSSSQTKRGDTPANQWADGISMACAGSTISGNTITDATDGGVVIFGAPGSTVSGNTIVSATRQLMGGVNMVDYNPWAGNYTGVTVSGNTFSTTGALMKIGIAVGAQSWGSANKSSVFTNSGTVTGNMFKSSSSGYFGFGISVAGANNVTVTPGNVFQFASFGGVNTKQCVGAGGNGPLAPPTPGPLYWDPTTTKGAVLQSSFVSHALAFLVCIAPGAVVKSGYTTFS